MIVLEGPDGSGKSTLAQQLSKDLEIPIAPRVVSSGAIAMVDLVKWVEDNLRTGYQQVIFDRHRLISEMIYGPLLKGGPSEGFDDFHWLANRQAEFQSLNPTVIVCLPPLDKVRQNIWADEDNHRLFANQESVDRLYWMYFNWAAANPDYLMYNYTVDNYDHLRRYIQLNLSAMGNR